MKPTVLATAIMDEIRAYELATKRDRVVLERRRDGQLWATRSGDERPVVVRRDPVPREDHLPGGRGVHPLVHVVERPGIEKREEEDATDRDEEKDAGALGHGGGW